MRRLRIGCVVVALAASLVWTVPVAARPEGAAPTTWGTFAGRLVDWAAGVWRVVAGSETEPPATGPVDADGPEGVALGGSGETLFGTAECEGEKTPALDPDG